MARTTKSVTPAALLAAGDAQDQRFEKNRAKEAAALAAADAAKAEALDAVVKADAYLQAAGILADAGIE